MEVQEIELLASENRNSKPGEGSVEIIKFKDFTSKKKYGRDTAVRTLLWSTIISIFKDSEALSIAFVYFQGLASP